MTGPFFPRINHQRIPSRSASSRTSRSITATRDVSSSLASLSSRFCVFSERRKDVGGLPAVGMGGGDRSNFYHRLISSSSGVKGLDGCSSGFDGGGCFFTLGLGHFFKASAG